LGSRVVNRTAAFVFFISDRFYGTVLAFVPGKAARTTSSPAPSLCRFSKTIAATLAC
jgi:hypothetical protein